MSNRKKDGDFNLDEELRNNIIASEEGQILKDDHEDVIEPDGDAVKTEDPLDPIVITKKANQKKYLDVFLYDFPHGITQYAES